MSRLVAPVATLLILALSAVGAVVTDLRVSSVVPPGAVAAAVPGALTVDLKAGSLARDFRLLAGPYLAERPIYVLVDPAYPIVDSTLHSTKGLLDHLQTDLAGTGWTGTVNGVDAIGLASVVAGSHNSIVVIPSEAIPVTVLGPKRDFQPLRDYMLAGGELIMTGGGPFYWAGYPGQKTVSLSETRSRIGWAGEVAVLGADLVHDPLGDPTVSAQGSAPSPLGAQMGTGFADLERGPLVDVLGSLRGWDLGWDGSAPGGSMRTSLAVVPLGRGRLVLFGGGLGGAEIRVAEDITRMLLSGMDIGPSVAASVLHVKAGSEIQTQLKIASLGPGAPVRLMVGDEIAFTFFHRTIVARI